MKILFLALLFCSQLAAAIPDVHGHRGSRWTHPENSIVAMNEALLAGADFLELDLVMSADNKLVLSHDPVIDLKICQRKDKKKSDELVVRKLTYNRLKQWECGIGNRRFPNQVKIPGTEMPLFEDLLKWLRMSKIPQAKVVKLNVETKFSLKAPTATAKEYANELARLLKKYNVVQRTVIQSFDFSSLYEIRKIIPKISVSMLIWTQSWEDLQTDLEFLKPNIISSRVSWLSQERVKEIQARGMEVAPWTVNDEKTWKKLVDWKVDGIITDRPRDLVLFLKGK